MRWSAVAAAALLLAVLGGGAYSLTKRRRRAPLPAAADPPPPAPAAVPSRPAAGEGPPPTRPPAAPATSAPQPAGPAPPPCAAAGAGACEEAAAARSACRPAPPPPPQPAGRVAVCYFGVMRAMRVTLCNHWQMLLSPLLAAGFAVDTFAHTFVMRRAFSNPRSGEFDVRLRADWHLLPFLRAVRTEDQGDYLATLGNITAMTPVGFEPSYDGKDTANLRCQGRSLARVTSLWTGGRYDFVVYLRPDIALLDPPDIASAAAWARKGEPWWAASKYDWYGGVNDRFALGSPDAMRKYGNKDAWFLNFTHGNQLHSEKLLAWAMKAQGAPSPTLLPFRVIRVRSQSKHNLTITPDVRLVESFLRERRNLSAVGLPAAWIEAEGREKRPKRIEVLPGHALERTYNVIPKRKIRSRGAR